MKVIVTSVALTFLCGTAAFGQHAPGGVGISLTIAHREQGKQLQIMGVAPNTPASRAGLAAGQVIRSIDGVPTQSLKLTDVVARIRGPLGTKVVLELEDRVRKWTNSVELTFHGQGNGGVSFETRIRQ